TTSVGSIEAKNASENSFGDDIIVSTDPPYYDNIGYADLSDFFYVRLRHTLRNIHPALFRRVLTPKREELVATPYRHGSKEEAESFFLNGMKLALRGVAEATQNGAAVVYYAFKQSETGEDGVTSAGWSTFLQAV